MPITAEYRVHKFIEATDCQIGGPNPWDPQINDPSVYERIVRDGSLGMGETYMDGLWDCQALDQLTDRLLRAGSVVTHFGFANVAQGAAKAAIYNLQNTQRAAVNAQAHYDIGNELYIPMLGSTRAYSCAYWKQFGGPKGANDLDSAQTAKFDIVCRKLQLQKGMRILDIGCGWGGLLTHAVNEYGVDAVGITPAKEQVQYIKDNKLPFEVRNIDWREIKDGPFHRVLSVGMFEHVGPKNYHDYFERTNRLLTDDGINFVHTIGADRTRYLIDPWIGKYIFPNGHIPSSKQLKNHAREFFKIADIQEMGENYDPTLMAWYENFQAAWPEISQTLTPDGALKYSNRFRRMWEYYLLTSAGSFRSGHNRLFQVVYLPNGISTEYTSVR